MTNVALNCAEPQKDSTVIYKTIIGVIMCLLVAFIGFEQWQIAGQNSMIKVQNEYIANQNAKFATLPNQYVRLERYTSDKNAMTSILDKLNYSIDRLNDKMDSLLVQGIRSKVIK